MKRLLIIIITVSFFSCNNSKEKVDTSFVGYKEILQHEINGMACLAATNPDKAYHKFTTVIDLDNCVNIAISNKDKYYEKLKDKYFGPLTLKINAIEKMTNNHYFFDNICNKNKFDTLQLRLLEIYIIKDIHESIFNSGCFK